MAQRLFAVQGLGFQLIHARRAASSPAQRGVAVPQVQQASERVRDPRSATQFYRPPSGGHAGVNQTPRRQARRGVVQSKTISIFHQ